MAGYAHDYSMSNNAIAAYDNGLRPASKISQVPAALIRAHVGRSEWHHASKMYNRVDFYDPAEVLAIFGLAPHEDFEPDARAVAALAAHKAAAAAPQVTTYTDCAVEWLQWGGTKKHPRATERRATGCTVSVKRETATITLPSGASFIKRVATRGFRWTGARA